jgi:hypothetical protein
MTIDLDNLVENFIQNSVAIFEDNRRSLGVKAVFDEDLYIIPTFPSISISCSSFWNELRTIGSNNVRYEFLFTGTIWYYHESLSPDTRKNLVMRNAYKVAEHIIKNASLNGWLTNTRAIVRACSYVPRLRSGGFIGAARIIYMAPYQTRVQSIS